MKRPEGPPSGRLSALKNMNVIANELHAAHIGAPLR